MCRQGVLDAEKLPHVFGWDRARRGGWPTASAWNPQLHSTASAMLASGVWASLKGRS